jgi:hypothetical protein
MVGGWRGVARISLSRGGDDAAAMELREDTLGGLARTLSGFAPTGIGHHSDWAASTLRAASHATSLRAVLSMETTTKLVTGACVLAALLYGIWTTNDAPAPVAPVESSMPERTENADTLGSGEIRAARAEVAAAVVDESAEVAEMANVTATATARDPWLLELTVEGAGVPRRPTEAVLTGINGYNWPEELALRVTFDAPGRAEIDVRRMIAIYDRGAPRMSAISGVRVRIEHPECISRLATVDVITDGTQAAAPLQPLELHVTLDRAAVLTGEVVFPGIDLAREVAVLAYPMGDDTPDKTAPLAVVAPDDRGRFRIRSTSAGRVAVVALQHDFRPVTRVVSVAMGATQELGRLEAVVGAALTGVVMFGEQPIGAGARVRIRVADADRTWGGLRAGSLSGLELAWCEGRFEWGQRFATTDVLGRFTCDGLGPSPVEAYVDMLPEHSSFAIPGDTRASATPPADIVLTFGGVAVALGYDFGGARATSGRLALEVANGRVSEREVPAHIAVQQPTRFTCAPDVSIVARAEFEGFEPATLSFRSPSTPGGRVTQRFELKPSTTSPASLHVRADARGAPLPDGTILQLAFEPLDPAHVPAGRPHVEAITVVGGEATLAKAPLGPQRVRVYPSQVAARRTTRYVDQVFELGLAPGDSRTLRCDFVLGGNVSFQARAPDGQLVAGRCRLLDEERNEVDAGGFFTELPGASYGGFTDRGLSTLRQNLPPGRYTVELTTDAYAPYTEVIEVRAGEVTGKSFQLSRR